jgi:hypothetical protein
LAVACLRSNVSGLAIAHEFGYKTHRYPAWRSAMPETTDPTFPCGPGAADARFLPHGDDFHCLRLHQTRLQGGDASSDSYYYTG